MSGMKSALLAALCGALFAVLLAAGCGGSQSSAAAKNQSADDLDTGGIVGDTHATAPEEGGTEANAEGSEAGDAAAGTGKPAAAAAAPPVTFRLVNTANEDLVFSLDKGWQPVIFGFSGKPPNAKPIIMFPKHCTAACDAENACPVCEAPADKKAARAAEQRQVVAAGSSFDVPWDGKVFLYEKPRGKKSSCECFRTEAVSPESYTVRACGLRLSKSAKKSSKLQCVDGTMLFPADGPQVVELNFPAP